MSDYRPIDASERETPKTPFEPGAAPMLQWIKIADFVVDDRYQRPIYGAGQGNVRRIADGFCWSKFAPVICAPVEGGKFAIIDGQHRTTAAALRGIESVPAQVVIATTTEQAEAFKAINGQVTRIHALALHRAGLMAGDTAAAEIDDTANRAGVTILRYPLPVEKLKPGETLALGSIREGIKAFGQATVVTALTCVTETSNNVAGGLSASVVRALCSVLAANATWREAGGALLEAFDTLDLESELEEAKLTRRPKGVATWEILAERITAHLRAALTAKEAA